MTLAQAEFQSTPPVWGATIAAVSSAPTGAISIHAPRVGGDDMLPAETGWRVISIHAPRVGGDDMLPAETGWRVISIHAPRVGGDLRVE